MPNFVESAQSNWNSLPPNARVWIKRAAAAFSGGAAAVIESALDHPGAMNWEHVAFKAIGAGTAMVFWLMVHPK